MGRDGQRPRSRSATKLLITADAGGSNGYRVKLWKVELAKLAHETGLEITVCHYPPGTSKWNKIEHKMFSFISMNWRGRPLVSYRTIIELHLRPRPRPRVSRSRRRGPQLLRDRHQGQRRRARCRATQAAQVPRRLELHDCPIRLSVSPNAMQQLRPGPYQIQAAIVACHATARDAAATDWTQIAALYERLADVAPSPVIELNRAVAVAMAHGPAAGLTIVESLAATEPLAGYHLLPAVRADLLRQLDRTEEAARYYGEALSLATTESERRFLARRLAETTSAK